MTRYIDSEELAKRITENIKADAPEEKELIEWCKDECIRQGYAMPAADVVPKSEVEYLKEHLKCGVRSTKKQEKKSKNCKQILHSINLICTILCAEKMKQRKEPRVRFLMNLNIYLWTVKYR